MQQPAEAMQTSAESIVPTSEALPASDESATIAEAIQVHADYAAASSEAAAVDSKQAAIAREREALLAQLARAQEQLDALSGDLRAVESELESLATDRKRHQLLLEACSSLEQLRQIGGAEIFWGDEAAVELGAEHIRRAQNAVDVFNKRLEEIEERRSALVEQIRRQQSEAGVLEDGIFEVQEEEERLQQEWIIEREVSDLPARKTVMAWARGGEDDRRFRKTLATALTVSIVFAIVIPMIEIPSIVQTEKVEVPERVVRLMEQRRRPPPPLQSHDEPKPQPKPQPEKKLAQQPVPERQPIPEQSAPVEPAEKGILAFRDKFSSLRQSSLSPRLGRQARISTSDENAAGATQRSMLTTAGPGSSGGINLASLSRDVGGGGGGVQGVEVSRVASGIGGGANAERPVSGDSPGLGRTDEEIQIVFDRYKSALYRLYNRELRKDPTLRGQIVLRLTIEPNGSVSFCQLQRTDMNAPDLAAQVVERVKSFDFGAKDVQAVTIVYPIDFLPAA